MSNRQGAESAKRSQIMSNMAVPRDAIRQAIILLRGQKVILDRDLAALYGVPTKALKQAVKRNADRFPDDFMFVLTHNELSDWRSQFVTSKADRMGLRYPPMAFTEQGVAMLSSVLNSERAIHVNITIMRAFVQLRRLLETHDDLARKLTELEKKYDVQFRAVFDAIRQLMAPPEPTRKQIGFHVRERREAYGAKRRGKGRRTEYGKDQHTSGIDLDPPSPGGFGAARRQGDFSWLAGQNSN